MPTDAERRRRRPPARPATAAGLPSLSDLDPDNVEIQELDDGRWQLVEGGVALIVFDELEAAQDGRDLVQFYELSNFCFVDRPDPPMTYWLR